MVNVLMWGRFFPVYRKFHWKGEIWPAWLLNNNFSNGPLEKKKLQEGFNLDETTD